MRGERSWCIYRDSIFVLLIVNRNTVSVSNNTGLAMPLT